jgi:hypothetical protein
MLSDTGTVWGNISANTELAEVNKNEILRSLTSLNICPPGPPSLSQICTVANRQGSVIGGSEDSVERMSDSTVNDALFGVGY